MQGVDSDEQKQRSRDNRLLDKKDVSGRIGESSRFIGFGLIALTFTIHGSSNEFPKSIVQSYEFLLNMSGFLGCLTVLFDYLQYICGYFSVNHALKRDSDNFLYDPKSPSYKGRIFFFWAKQASAFLGGAIIVAVIGMAVLLK